MREETPSEGIYVCTHWQGTDDHKYRVKLDDEAFLIEHKAIDSCMKDVTGVLLHFMVHSCIMLCCWFFNF